jgi:hypothetical protein
LNVSLMPLLPSVFQSAVEKTLELVLVPGFALLLPVFRAGDCAFMFKIKSKQVMVLIMVFILQYFY